MLRHRWPVMRACFQQLPHCFEIASQLGPFLVRMHNRQELVLVDRVSDKGEPLREFYLHAVLRRREPNRHRLFGLRLL